MSRYLSVNEIAAELDVSSRTVYRLLEGGLLKGFKTGRVWRVSRNDLHEFMADKSNLDMAAIHKINSPSEADSVKPYEDISLASPGSRSETGYRVLLERRLAGCSTELFELPLAVKESRGGFTLNVHGDTANSLKLPGPDKRQSTIRRFLQSNPDLWQKIKHCFIGNVKTSDWETAFKQENLDSSEKTALQWAYNLDDSATRPLIEEASVSDRLGLLDKMGPAQRRAALASLQSLYDDGLEVDNQR